MRMAKSKAQVGRFDSLQGMTFGMWTVVAHDKADECVVRCECGYAAVRTAGSLKSGSTASCRTCSVKKRMSMMSDEERRVRQEASARASSERFDRSKQKRAKPEPNKEGMKQWRSNRSNELRSIVNEIKKAPCLDCGNSYPSICMDFDHRPGVDKRAGISDLVKKCCSLDVLEAELAKCDLVCANCHRIRTWKRTLELGSGSYHNVSESNDIGPSPSTNPPT